MYFAACARLAKAHPDIAQVIDTVDRRLRELDRGALITPSDLAYLLREPASRVEAVLELLAEDGPLSTECFLPCKRCETLNSVGRAECAACGELLDGATSVVRYRLSIAVPRPPKPQPAGTALMKAAIQFIVGDRGGDQRHQLQTPKEYKAIQDATNGGKHRDYVNVLPPILAASIGDLAGAYKAQPLALHFGGHGQDRSLMVIQSHGLLPEPAPLAAEQLCRILSAFPAPKPRLCVLNTCHSRAIAEHLVNQSAVALATGWDGVVDDSTAIEFARRFYEHLVEGLAVRQAFLLARISVACDEPPRVHTFTRADLDADQVSFFSLASIQESPA